MVTNVLLTFQNTRDIQKVIFKFCFQNSEYLILHRSVITICLQMNERRYTIITINNVSQRDQIHNTERSVNHLVFRRKRKYCGLSCS